MTTQLSGHSATVTSIAYPSAANPWQLLSSACDGTVRLWDTRTSAEAVRLPMPEPEVLAATLSASGHLLAAGERGMGRGWGRHGVLPWLTQGFVRPSVWCPLIVVSIV